MSFCCECYVLSGRGLCYEFITRPEESYRLWCVVVCDLEKSRMSRLVSFMCCQVEVSATSLSLVQRSPTDCGVSLCVT